MLTWRSSNVVVVPLRLDLACRFAVVMLLLCLCYVVTVMSWPVCCVYRSDPAEGAGDRRPEAEDRRGDGGHAQPGLLFRHQRHESRGATLLFQVHGHHLRPGPQRLRLPAPQEVTSLLLTVPLLLFLSFSLSLSLSLSLSHSLSVPLFPSFSIHHGGQRGAPNQRNSACLRLRMFFLSLLFPPSHFFLFCFPLPPWLFPSFPHSGRRSRRMSCCVTVFVVVKTQKTKKETSRDGQLGSCFFSLVKVWKPHRNDVPSLI